MMTRILRAIRSSTSTGTIEFPAGASVSLPQLVSKWARRGMCLLGAGWIWVRERQQSRSCLKRLHLEETISLGQKRFIALIRVDGHRLLVGGGATELALLANLDPGEPFSALVKETAVAPVPRPPKRTRKRAANPKAESKRCA